EEDERAERVLARRREERAEARDLRVEDAVELLLRLLLDPLVLEDARSVDQGLDRAERAADLAQDARRRRRVADVDRAVDDLAAGRDPLEVLADLALGHDPAVALAHGARGRRLVAASEVGGEGELDLALGLELGEPGGLGRRRARAAEEDERRLRGAGE